MLLHEKHWVNVPIESFRFAVRFQPTGLCFHDFAMIQTYAYLFSIVLKPVWLFQIKTSEFVEVKMCSAAHRTVKNREVSVTRPRALLAKLVRFPVWVLYSVPTSCPRWLRWLLCLPSAFKCESVNWVIFASSCILNQNSVSFRPRPRGLCLAYLFRTMWVTARCAGSLGCVKRTILIDSQVYTDGVSNNSPEMSVAVSIIPWKFDTYSAKSFGGNLSLLRVTSHVHKPCACGWMYTLNTIFWWDKVCTNENGSCFREMGNFIDIDHVVKQSKTGASRRFHQGGRWKGWLGMLWGVSCVIGTRRSRNFPYIG